jgi:AraC-like DNA-binding protein
LAKIAVEAELAGRILAQGDGWSVEDVVCSSGPRDRPFEERHSHVSIAIVAAGTFQYRAQNSAGRGCELMTPGSVLLGDAGQFFECGHEHGTGDRCISFRYTPDYFERLSAGARFRVPRLPPLRQLSALVARACAGLNGSQSLPWEELSIQLAAQALQLAGASRFKPNSATPSALARVTRTVRLIEQHPQARLDLGSLAREARLSRYHFLRTFEGLAGLTPHQYVLRARLREAASRLAKSTAAVLDIALESGFGDVSNFNRAFRNEFGVSPRAFRA